MRVLQRSTLHQTVCPVTAHKHAQKSRDYRDGDRTDVAHPQGTQTSTMFLSLDRIRPRILALPLRQFGISLGKQPV